MDYEDFQRFERLAQFLHFGRAAQSLGLSPSALTRRVQALEEELGARLVLRDSRSVELTRAGEHFRRFARAQIERLDELRRALKSEDDSPSGDLHIACTVTACHSVLPRLLALCRERYPGITLRLVTQDASRSLAQLESGEVDLAVVPTDGPPPEHLVSRVLTQTEFRFIAPPDEAFDLPARQAEGKEIPFVAPLGGLERKRLDAWLVESGFAARIVAEVRGNEGIIAMVSLGSGLGMVPELVLRSSPLPVRLLSSVCPPPGYDVSLCARRRSLERPTVRAFLQLAEETDL